MKFLRKSHVGQAVCLALALSLNAGCTVNDRAGAAAPDYAAACGYLLPVLKQHSAFGADLFYLTSPDLDSAELSEVAAVLREGGAAVQIGPYVTARDSAVGVGKDEPALMSRDLSLPGEVRHLEVRAHEQGSELLVSLRLDDALSLHCGYRLTASGSVEPMSAVSVARGS